MIAFQRQRRVEAEIGVTPLVDIIFQLLLFFALSARFEAARTLPVSLPGAVYAEPSAARGLTVTVAADGRLFLDDRPVAAAHLADELRAALATAPRRAVRIEADAAAPVQAAVAALDAAKGAGAAAVAFATRSFAEPSAP